MQAELALYGTQEFAKYLGDMHEKDGIVRNQPKGEEMMDLHNNQQGHEIAKEMIEQFGLVVKNPAISHYTRTIIAEKVWQRMKDGKIILDPTGRTKLKQDRSDDANSSVKNDKNKKIRDSQLKINKKSGAEMSEKTACVGSYQVSGYTRSDGTEVKGYTRTCGAKHIGKKNLDNSSINSNIMSENQNEKPIEPIYKSNVIMHEREHILDKYKGKKAQNLTKEEIYEFLRAYYL